MLKKTLVLSWLLSLSVELTCIHAMEQTSISNTSNKRSATSGALPEESPYKKQHVDGNDLNYNLGNAIIIPVRLPQIFVNGIPIEPVVPSTQISHGTAMPLIASYQSYVVGAALGDKIAQYELGLCYLHGKNMKANIFNAAQLFQMASEQGYKPAGQMLENIINSARQINFDAVLSEIGLCLFRHELHIKSADSMQLIKAVYETPQQKSDEVDTRDVPSREEFSQQSFSPSALVPLTLEMAQQFETEEFHAIRILAALKEDSK